MSTRMAPTYAKFFMKYLEHELLDTVPYKSRIHLRVVDNIFLLWRYGKNELHRFKTMINNYHPITKFTVTADHNEIPFCDTTVYRGRNNYLLTRLYHRPNDNKLYLTIILHTLQIRCRRISCEDRFFQQEARLIRKKLSNRKYLPYILEEAYNTMNKINRLDVLKNNRIGEREETKLTGN